jgi:hypothetical protein
METFITEFCCNEEHVYVYTLNMLHTHVLLFAVGTFYILVVILLLLLKTILACSCKTSKQVARLHTAYELNLLFSMRILQACYLLTETVSFA